MIDDAEFEDKLVASVRAERSGWSITSDDGWSFGVPADSPVVPAVGMTARFYGVGVGYAVRGFALDGVTVFYRSAVDDEVYQDEQLYGKDAADVLARWDAGRSVWSVEMGGLGPGYEQALQITAFEILRHLLSAKYDAAAWVSTEAWKVDRDKIEKAVFPVVDGLGLSGAQWGAALHIAFRQYRDGPLVFIKSAPDDRKIQVSKDWPRLAA